MTSPRRCGLTYANVVATIALFVSLGGVSYAALTLPPRSVGPQQLRPHAVNASALAIALGVAGTTDPRVSVVDKSLCNAPLLPGEVAPPCAPPPFGIAATAGRTLIVMRAPGQVFVSAVAALRNDGPAGSTATVSFVFTLDGRPARTVVVTSDGSTHAQVPLQALIRAPAGRRSVGLGYRVRYSTREPGNVSVGPVSMIAAALPVT